MRTQAHIQPGEPHIYRSVGVPTLLSRGWNLFRANVKESMLVMLPPAVINALSGIVLSLPSALPTLTSNVAVYGMASLLAIGLGFVLQILNSYLWLFCLSILCHRYDQTLILGSPPPLGKSFERIRQQLLPLLLIFTIIGLLYFAFGLLDVVLFIGAILGVYAVILLIIGGVAQGLGNLGPELGMALAILFFIMGTLAGLGLITLVSLQMVICYLPVVAVINSRPERGAITSAFKHSFRLIFRNFPRAVLFGLLMFILSTTLSFAMSMPIQMWNLFELLFNRAGEPGVVPFHVSVVSSLYSILIGTILWPFIFAGLTLFWYDCRVRSGGLDIHLALARLSKRFMERTGGIQQPGSKKSTADG